MKTLFLLSLLAVFAMSVQCREDFGELSVRHYYDPHINCEHVVARTMELMCAGIGMPLNDVKIKDHDAVRIFDHLDNDVNDLSTFNWRWMSRANRLARLPARLPHAIPLIVKECCRKPCSFSEILLHC